MLRRSLLQLPLALALVVAAAGPAQAEPQDAYATGDVHLVTTASSPWVAHTIRHDDGRWDRFNWLPVARQMAVNPSSTVSGGELHLVYQSCDTGNPGICDTYLRTRHLDGTWSNERLAIPYDHPRPRPGGTGVAVVNGELHVLVRSDTSRTYHLVRHLDGSWSPSTELTTEGSGASVANVNGVLHLVMTSGSSNTVLRLMTWRTGVGWSEPVDTAVLPNPNGARALAGIAQVGGDLHAVVSTADGGGLYHAIRRPDGGWTEWGDVGREAGVPGPSAAVAVTAARNALHVAITTSDGGLFHTIRFTDRTWQRFGSVKGEAGDVSTYGGVTIAGE
jgi:hypothetical protein